MNIISPEPVPEEFVLVFDTETTGLPGRNANPQEYSLYDGARMVEIAWDKYTVDGRFHSRESYIVAPNGFTIPDFVANIHGITTDMAHSLGHPIMYVWSRLMIALENVVTIVAHNISFDNGIVLSEMYRYAASSAAEDDTTEAIRELIRKWTSIPQQCTMLMGSIKMSTRWMKLATLYTMCFNKEPEVVLHRAAADAAICREIYFHLTKL
jgi:DNA polymerase-3 subunit alpha